MQLKERIDQLHKQAEQTKLSQQLVSGTISEESYLYYLASKLLISTPIEKYIQLHTDIKRSHLILNDIRNLKIKFTPQTYLSAALDYSQYIAQLPTEQIYAHLYVNYLGDMYGGQIIAKNLPFQATHLHFDNRSECIAAIRQHVVNTDEFVQEANTAFEWIIKIYEQIQP